MDNSSSRFATMRGERRCKEGGLHLAASVTGRNAMYYSLVLRHGWDKLKGNFEKLNWIEYMRRKTETQTQIRRDRLTHLITVFEEQLN